MARRNAPTISPRTAIEHERRIGAALLSFVAAYNDALASGYEVTDPILRKEKRFACTVIEVDRAPRVSGAAIAYEEEGAA